MLLVRLKADSGKRMLGSSSNKHGNSYWIGTQFPISKFDGKFGIEYIEVVILEKFYLCRGYYDRF